MTQLAVVPPTNTKSVLLDMADRFGMMPEAFEQTLRATVVPANCSKEQFAAFLLVAKEYKLNPILKEIYAFPSRGGIQPIVGVDGWANLINSHPAFDGMDFEDHMKDGELEAVTCKMHRKDRSHPITATEYMAECKRPTEPWKQWPRRMLRHKAMIQAARYAFSFAGIVDPDEAERIAADLAHDVTPRVPLVERLQVATTGPLPGFSEQHVIIHTSPSSQDASPPVPDTGPEPTPAPVDRSKSSGAGTPSQESSVPTVQPAEDESAQASGQGNPAQSRGAAGLPPDWAKNYADALRRAQKPSSLPKYAAQFWQSVGVSWDAVKASDDAPTAIAVYDTFANHFGKADVIAAQLHELGAD